MKSLIRELEERIVKKLVQDALAIGYRLSVSLERGYDIDEMLLGATDETLILKEAFAGDECHIFFHAVGDELTEDGKVVSSGWVYLVLGNEGWDVISDYTTNLESVLSGAFEISNQYA